MSCKIAFTSTKKHPSSAFLYGGPDDLNLKHTIAHILEEPSLFEDSLKIRKLSAESRSLVDVGLFSPGVIY